MNTTIQIRIDSLTKAKAQRNFKKMGVGLSFAIKYFLTKVANAKNFNKISDLDVLVSETIEELKIIKARKEVKGKQYVSQKFVLKKLGL